MQSLFSTNKDRHVFLTAVSASSESLLSSSVNISPTWLCSRCVWCIFWQAPQPKPLPIGVCGQRRRQCPHAAGCTTNVQSTRIQRSPLLPLTTEPSRCTRKPLSSASHAAAKQSASPKGRREAGTTWCMHALAYCCCSPCCTSKPWHVVCSSVTAIPCAIQICAKGGSFAAQLLNIQQSTDLSRRRK